MSLVEALKKGLFRATPALYLRLQEAWTSYEVKRITQRIIARHGLVIQEGPFAGMHYLPEAAGSSLLPKLLGCYEAELHSTLTEAIKADYSHIIDVGCAEGYYAVGLAILLVDARVFAFDIDPRARELCEAIARLNGVSERVEVAGECAINHLASVIEGANTDLRGRTLILCDCEGCEMHLLNPDLVPRLKGCDILVELHDLIDRNISKTIVSRFQGTHDISLITSTKRDPSSFKALEGLSDRARRVAVSEFRDGQMQWAFMRARERNG